MQDSLFDDLNKMGNVGSKPSFKKSSEPVKSFEKKVTSKPVVTDSKPVLNKDDFDDLLNELNDVIGTDNQEETG